MLTALLVKLLAKKKKSNFSNLCFDDVKLERKNNSIIYYGNIRRDLAVAGFINSGGFGEEYFIIRNHPTGFKQIKRHKVRKFRTAMNSGHFRGEYFTRSCLENLVRIKAF